MKKLFILIALIVSFLSVKAEDIKIQVSRGYVVDKSLRASEFESRKKIYDHYRSKGYTFLGVVTEKGKCYLKFLK